MSTPSRNNRWRFARLAAVAVLALACAAPAKAAPLDDFFTAHPRFAILPAPYFDPDRTTAAYADVHLAATAFVPAGTPWYATLSFESDHGEGYMRFPDEGTTTASGWNAFLPLGDRRIENATLSICTETPTALTEVGDIQLSVHRTRFSSLYRRGQRARQCSWRWGEDGAWLVVLQQRYAPDFYRSATPTLYLGGDFHYERVEDLVRFLRTHGVDALGYKPDYARAMSLLQMAQTDWPDVRQYLNLTGTHNTRLVGLCLGGLIARGLAHVSQPEDRVLSVTTIGTPNRGSLMAELYNRMDWLQSLNRVIVGEAGSHPYQDAQDAVQAFNQAIGPCPVPLSSVTLDAAGHRLDPRYWLMDGPLRWVTGFEAHQNPSNLHTDGLILSEDQPIGRSLGVWNTDHAGMINEGRASEYFDAYEAHLKLVQTLEQEAK
ncbi:MAG TPA: hypothetical protein V6D47_05075 [Oscillatoriaceae cyanobacterium]